MLQNSSEEDISKALSDINHSNIFLNPPHTVMKIKPKINKWYLIKLKSFCIAKETTHKIKRQLTEWEKIFADKLMIKGVISKVYKQFIQLTIKKKNQKMSRRPKKTVLQRKHTDGQQTHETMLNSTHY